MRLSLAYDCHDPLLPFFYVTAEPPLVCFIAVICTRSGLLDNSLLLPIYCISALLQALSSQMVLCLRHEIGPYNGALDIGQSCLSQL